MKVYLADPDSGTATLEPIGGIIGTVALLAARYLPLDRLDLALCPLRAATRLPCFLCGGTRSFVAASHLDFPAAWNFNPLASVLAAALMVLVPYAAFAFLFAWRRPRIRLDRKWEPALLRTVVISVVGIQWSYLIFR